MHQDRFVFIASVVEKWSISLAFIRRELARSNRAPERLRRLMIGRLPVEEYGASLTLVVAANFAGVR